MRGEKKIIKSRQREEIIISAHSDSLVNNCFKIDYEISYLKYFTAISLPPLALTLSRSLSLYISLLLMRHCPLVISNLPSSVSLAKLVPSPSPNSSPLPSHPPPATLPLLHGPYPDTHSHTSHTTAHTRAQTARRCARCRRRAHTRGRRRSVANPPRAPTRRAAAAGPTSSPNAPGAEGGRQRAGDRGQRAERRGQRRKKEGREERTERKRNNVRTCSENFVRLKKSVSRGVGTKTE